MTVAWLPRSARLGLCFVLKYKAVQKPRAFSLFEVVLADCLKNILQRRWKKSHYALQIFLFSFTPFFQKPDNSPLETGSRVAGRGCPVPAALRAGLADRL